MNVLIFKFMIVCIDCFKLFQTISNENKTCNAMTPSTQCKKRSKHCVITVQCTLQYLSCKDTCGQTSNFFGTQHDVKYLSLNLLLTSPASYGKESSVKEYQRISFTRLRLSSHRLRIETGRWSRIAPDQRLCNCGEIQTEDHVLFHCPATANIRLTYHMNSQETFHSIMSSRDISEICAFCHDTLTVFAN